jgi:hypothetical protein
MSDLERRARELLAAEQHDQACAVVSGYAACTCTRSLRAIIAALSEPAQEPTEATWMGLTRTRFAEVLYEHEGFVDHARDKHMPDRETPVWIDDALTEVHCGDCTQVPASCMVCHAKMALEQADEFAAMVAKAARSAPPAEEKA